jgi:hypothetical protein
MLFYPKIAFAGPLMEGRNLAHNEGAAPGFDETASPELLDDPARIRPTYSRKVGKLLMRHSHFASAAVLYRTDDPLRSTLLDRMCCIAGRRLEDLCYEAVSVSCEQLPQRRRLVLRFGQLAD